MNKWQKEIHRFTKQRCKIMKREVRYRRIRRLTRWPSKFYTFAEFKKDNNMLLERARQRLQ